MAIYSFDDFTPVLDESSFVHPLAAVIGNVVIGKHVYIGPGAVIRADWGEIVIEDGCNVQENCVIHVFPGATVKLEEGAHVGHGAVIHGANLGRNVLIGMNSVIMDKASIGANSIVGALCFVPAQMIVPEGKVVVGNPAKIVKDVSPEMLQWKKEGTALYQRLPQQCFAGLKEVQPLRAVPQKRRSQEAVYKTWRETAGK